MTYDREAQLKYELEQDAVASAERLEKLRAQALDGDVTLPKASRFIGRAYATVKESMEKEQQVMRRGPGAKFGKWLKALDLNVASVLAIRECITHLTGHKVRTKPVTVQVLAGAIGRLFELEIRIKEAELVNPVYMDKIHEQVKERRTTSKHHLSGVYTKAYEQVMKDFADSKLSAPEVVQLGKFGLQACMDAGLVVQVKAYGNKGKMYYYEMADEVSEFLHSYDNRDVAGVMDNCAGTMSCPPDPWTSLMGGGYLSPRRKQHASLMSLHGVRKSERARLRAAFTAENMPKVFECANYMQGTAMELHKPTLDRIKSSWQLGGGIMGIPTRFMPPKPVCPLPEDWNKAKGTDEELAVFFNWKRQATAWYDLKREWSSKVREIGGFMKAAAKPQGPLWLPVFMDTRGRWYYRSSPNPQGSDLAKACLHFHNKKALGPRGVYWLKVAVANSFGFDKERFDKRAEWTEQNWDVIVRSLSAPEDHADTFGSDSPWVMFSAAYELQQAYLSGNPETYCTGVPVHMDATCSGLQHFSALLLDPVGGQYVNLFDPEFVGPKQDIYSKVATNTLKALERDLESNDPVVVAMAQFWLARGIPRNMAKTPVMTYVYGATLRGTSEFVQDFTEKEWGSDIFGDDLSPFKSAMYLARKLFQGIGATVPAAEALMHWLRQVARQMPNGKRMEWPTPTGFLVQHDYQGFDEINVYLRSCGQREALVREFNDDTNSISMQNAISPNFVHALDASHLTLVALAMKALGLDGLFIHDSFGTHPSDVDTMHRLIREKFVELYQNDVLGDFLWAVGAEGEIPMRGRLELKQVLESEFFFC
ncbi:RNA polymerase [Pseudomonas phage Misse]|nr:RNA polymerase [Pseudomonas phage Misse]